MTDKNSDTLRKTLAEAISGHVKGSTFNLKETSEKYGIQYSRLSQICRGDVKSVSSDFLVDTLAALGYAVVPAIIVSDEVKEQFDPNFDGATENGE